MKIFKSLFITLFFMVFFIGTANAESYTISDVEYTIGVNGFEKSNPQQFRYYNSIDLKSDYNQFFSAVFYYPTETGIEIENNINQFTFPFSITDLEHNTDKINCTNVGTTQTSYTISYQTTYKDGSTSQNDGVINENIPAGAFCNNFNIEENNDYSINIDYWLSDYSQYNCLVTGTNNSNVAVCPIPKEKANGQYKVIQIGIIFTKKDNDLNTKVRVRMSNKIVKQNDTQQNILDVLNDLNSKINKSNNIQSQIQNNTNEIKTDIKSTNTSGSESAADDLKNNSAFQDNSGLSSVVSMPLTFVNSLSNTCQPITLNIPYFDVDMQIPCLQSIITEKMPALANILKVVINGFIIYRVLLDIFQIIRNAKNPEDDRIEVLDL